MRYGGLLVSVRNAEEAAEALVGGADIIDVKEPAHGSLGAADPHVVAEVAGVVGGDRPWTMACGELRDGRPEVAGRLERVLELLAAPAVPPAAVKVGLAGAAGSDWRGGMAAAMEALPIRVDRVAVAYADWRTAAAPPPPEVIAAARGLGCAALLIDTFDKSGPGLFGCCRPGETLAWIAAARAVGLAVALAGRIAAEEIPAAWAFRPDVVALRSAVCSNGRLGTVAAALVRRARWNGGDGPAEKLE